MKLTATPCFTILRLALLVLALPLAGAVSSHAATHRVVVGDTLSGLSKRYGVSIAEIRTANHLRTDVIRLGSVLTIPTPTPAVAEAEVEEKPATPAVSASDRLRLQLYLEAMGFSPGKIDGVIGKNSERALQGLLGSQARNEKSLEELLPAAREAVPEPTLEVEVPKVAARFVGEVPVALAEQEKLDRLGYASVAEFMSERYHTDLPMLARLNRGVDLGRLKAGDKLTVPNVRVPFLIEKLSGAPYADPAMSANRIEIDWDERQLRVIDPDGQLLASFPTTLGRKPEHFRREAMRLGATTRMPEFTWDEEMLKNGRVGKKQFVLPGGPNNPVGVVWMGLQLEGSGKALHIGIHGTNHARSIGTARSSGCIRLTNWDAVRLAALVAKGSPVKMVKRAGAGPAGEAAIASNR